MCGGGYIGRSARAVRAVGPGAREEEDSSPNNVSNKTNNPT